jgi:hypothetical protein
VSATAEPEVAKKGGKTEDAAKKPDAGAKKSDSGAGAKK